MELGFVRLRADARMPTRAHDGDAGLDLCAVEPALLGPGARASVPTGIAVEIPPGHAGLVLPRSGLALRHGIALVNCTGPDRRRLSRRAARPAAQHGPRVGVRDQRRATESPSWWSSPCRSATPVEVSELTTSERAGGGFGSSGR